MATAMATAQQLLLKTHVETGDVEGVTENGLAVYKAIPYAAPPVGNLRWKAPQPAQPWQGVLKADKWGPWPPQPSRRDGSQPVMSEDCLYLGIATPATSPNDRLPVMVWIHGGGFQTEYYGGDLWTSLARRGVVVVSVEYRTGALGFMAHPELTKEGGHSGNYGLLDQICALQWVQRNIAAFGGDPSKVTIFGESAGAISCSILCASPLAKGLFRAVISQSGGSFAPWQDAQRTIVTNASQKGAEQQGLDFQKHLKKKSLKQLRQMDAQALVGDNVGFYGFWPCVDGYVITDDLYRLYQRGEYNDVPAIVMTNSDEGALFSHSMSPEDYAKAVAATFGDHAGEAMRIYPGNTVDEAYQSYGDLFRDMGFAWPSYAWASLQNKHDGNKAYMAFLAQPSTRSLAQDKRRRGVAHADDILYLNGEFLRQPDKYPAEAAVAEIMQQYWVNFAKNLDPNAKGLPWWPAFDEQKPSVMQFSNGASLTMLPNREQLDFVDRFYQSVRASTEQQRLPGHALAKALEQRMTTLAKRGYMAGHQDDTFYGLSWEWERGRSDVKATVGDYPAVMGFDLGGIEMGDAKNLDSVPFTRIREELLAHVQRGGIVTLSWHPRNPLTGGTAWDVKDKTVVKSILPGGAKHAKFVEWMQRVADFLKTLKTKKGDPVPIIFRPWHENNGSWFWWGQDLCTDQEFKDLWNMLQDFLWHQGLGNLMWSYSPNLDGHWDEARFMKRYPGNSRATLIGEDAYQWGTEQDFVTQLSADLAFLTDFAQRNGKLLAMTECGYQNNPDATWFTRVLKPIMDRHPISYFLLWRNYKKEYFGPSPEQPCADDYRNLYKANNTLFLKDIR